MPAAGSAWPGPLQSTRRCSLAQNHSARRSHGSALRGTSRFGIRVHASPLDRPLLLLNPLAAGVLAAGPELGQADVVGQVGKRFDHCRLSSGAMSPPRALGRLHLRGRCRRGRGRSRRQQPSGAIKPGCRCIEMARLHCMRALQQMQLEHLCAVGCRQFIDTLQAASKPLNAIPCLSLRCTVWRPVLKANPSPRKPKTYLVMASRACAPQQSSSSRASVRSASSMLRRDHHSLAVLTIDSC